MASSQEEAKLERFLQWLQVNGAELRGCKIKYSFSNKGSGIFLANDVSDAELLLGGMEDNIRYVDMLFTTFGNPLWFTDDELLELKGTTLYRATELQKKSLVSLYDGKLRALVKKLLTLDRDLERANSLFWTHALNIPLPYSYVFPKIQEDCASDGKNSEVSTNICKELVNGRDGNGCQVEGVDIHVSKVISTPKQEETVWVEGLVPGIDFCNHDIKAAATWEVDETGSITGVPNSMYLLSAGQPLQIDAEISISYGSKGNEELLYLYGFVLDGNLDDYPHGPLSSGSRSKRSVCRLRKHSFLKHGRQLKY